jgi:hypothetical protein
MSCVATPAFGSEAQPIFSLSLEKREGAKAIKRWGQSTA